MEYWGPHSKVSAISCCTICVLYHSHPRDPLARLAARLASYRGSGSTHDHQRAQQWCSSSLTCCTPIARSTAASSRVAQSRSVLRSLLTIVLLDYCVLWPYTHCRRTSSVCAGVEYGCKVLDVTIEPFAESFDLWSALMGLHDVSVRWYS